MRDPLTGCRVKLDRADAHIQDLQARVLAFIASHPYELAFEFHQKTGEVSIYARQSIPPPILDWAPIIGDAVHNIRSALDHLVFALADAGPSGRAPVPLPDKGFWRDIAFPVCLGPDDWKGRSKGKLRGVPGTAVERIRSYQPFACRQDQPPREHWLWVLEELWNGDKHRSLHLAVAYISGAAPAPLIPMIVNLPTASIYFPGLFTRIVGTRPAGPLKYDEELLRVRFAPPTPLLSVGAAVMYFQKNLHLTFGVAFDKGTPGAEGTQIVSALKQLLDSASALIADFESEFP